MPAWQPEGFSRHRAALLWSRGSHRQVPVKCRIIRRWQKNAIASICQRKAAGTSNPLSMTCCLMARLQAWCLMQQVLSRARAQHSLRPDWCSPACGHAAAGCSTTRCTGQAATYSSSLTWRCPQWRRSLRRWSAAQAPHAAPAGTAQSLLAAGPAKATGAAASDRPALCCAAPADTTCGLSRRRGTSPKRRMLQQMAGRHLLVSA